MAVQSPEALKKKLLSATGAPAGLAAPTQANPSPGFQAATSRTPNLAAPYSAPTQQNAPMPSPTTAIKANDGPRSAYIHADGTKTLDEGGKYLDYRGNLGIKRGELKTGIMDDSNALREGGFQLAGTTTTQHGVDPTTGMDFDGQTDMDAVNSGIDPTSRNAGAVDSLNQEYERSARESSPDRLGGLSVASELNAGPDLDTDVASNVAAVASQDSNLMRQAATRGLQAANRRGMLNTTQSAQASQAAVLDRAIEIGGQNAAQNQERVLQHERAADDFDIRDRQAMLDAGMSQQQFQQTQALDDRQFEHQFQMSKQQFGQALALTEMEFSQQFAMSKQDFMETMALSDKDFQEAKGLSKQDFMQTMALSDQDFRQRFNLTKQEFNNAMRLSHQDFVQQVGMSKQNFIQDGKLQDARLKTQETIAQLDSDTQIQLMEMETDMRVQLERMGINNEKRAEFSRQITSAHELYQEHFRSVMSNDKLSAADRNQLLKNGVNNLNQTIKMWEALYKQDVKFDPKPITPPKNPTPTPPPVPGPNPNQPNPQPTFPGR